MADADDNGTDADTGDGQSSDSSSTVPEQRLRDRAKAAFANAYGTGKQWYGKGKQKVSNWRQQRQANRQQNSQPSGGSSGNWGGSATARILAAGAAGSAAAGAAIRTGARGAVNTVQTVNTHAHQNGNMWIIIAFILTMFDGKWFGDIFGYVFRLFGQEVAIPTFLDLAPFKGFYPPEFTQIDIVGLVMSSIFIFVVLLYFARKTAKGHITVMQFLIVCTLITYFLRARGWFNDLGFVSGASIFSVFLRGNVWWYAVFFSVVILIFAGILLIRRLRLLEGIFEIDDMTFMLLALVYTFFLMNTSWIQADWRALAHFIFITVFGLTYLSRAEEERPYIWHITLIAFLIFDFYGTKLAESYWLTKYVPFLLFATTLLIWQYERDNPWPIRIIIFAVVIYLLQFTLANYHDNITFQKVEPTPGELSYFERTKRAIRNFWEKQLEAATGGLYQAQVEDNKYEPLGVYIEDVKAVQPRFYEREPVTLFGTLRSKTLSDAVLVNFSCYKWTDKNERIPANLISPDRGFLVYDLEDVDFECTFDPADLTAAQRVPADMDIEDYKKNLLFESGTRTVTLETAYNFMTSAYQKAYFMEHDRYRAMVREGIDPLVQYKIADRNPVTIFTNGPVKIALNIGQVIRVQKKNLNDVINIPTILSIQLENRGQINEEGILGEFEGKIKEITELVVLLPRGLVLTEDGGSCQPIGFKKYELADCTKSCDEHKNLFCTPSCDGPPQKIDECRKECEQKQTDCQKECTEFFEAGAGKEPAYNGYALDFSKMKAKADDYKDIDRYRTFSCRMLASEEVLENTPLTTRFIRARARYTYVQTKSYPITVEKDDYGSNIYDVDAENTDYGEPYFTTAMPLDVYINEPKDAGYANEQKYSPYAKSLAQQHGVNYFLVKAIIQVETGGKWNPDADAPTSTAFGLMQVIKGTAKGVGCIEGWDNPTDPKPEWQIDCGIKALKDVINYQKNNPSVAQSFENIIAGYNQGAGGMKKTDGTTVNGIAYPDGYVRAVMSHYNKLIAKTQKRYKGSDLVADVPGVAEEVDTLYARLCTAMGSPQGQRNCYNGDGAWPCCWTSGLRASDGGSEHAKGLALDVHVGADIDTQLRWAETAGTVGFRGIIVYPCKPNKSPDTHIHVDLRKSNYYQDAGKIFMAYIGGTQVCKSKTFDKSFTDCARNAYRTKCT